MAIIPFIEEDYLATARTEVTEQFKNKIIFDKYLQLLIDQQEELQNVFKQLLQQRSIDEAVGAQLDIIGDIVGQPRELISVDLFDFFGFQGALKAGSFGDLNNASVGALMWDYGVPLAGNILLDDNTYRLFIKAKILKNNTASTPEEFISFISFLFNTKIFLVEGNAEYLVMFGRQLNTFERTLLNYVSYSQGYPSRLIPKTAGVRVNYGEFQENKYFGFEGAPGALGFGELAGDYGYGLGYGMNYGDSNYTQDFTGQGGYFASIY